MPLDTIPFDSADYLTEPEDQAELMVDAVESGDPLVIKHALRIVARARGMSQFARDAGLAPETLDKALGPDGDPPLSTLLGLLAALNLKLSARVEQPAAA